MQLQWNTVSRTMAESFAANRREISRHMRVWPAYGILSYFYMIPRVDLAHSSQSRFHKTSLFRMLLVLLTLSFILLVLLHDAVYFVMDRDFWTRYLASGSRIITLLLALRSILTFWKNCASVFLFLYKSKGLYRYVVELDGVVGQVTTFQAGKVARTHRITFAVVYFCPFFLMAARVVLTTLGLLQGQADRLVTLGFVQVPYWTRVVYYHFAEIIGGNGRMAQITLLLQNLCFSFKFHPITLLPS